MICPAVGLVSSLVQKGVMTRPTQLAGSSAGSLIAASFNAGGLLLLMLMVRMVLLIGEKASSRL